MCLLYLSNIWAKKNDKDLYIVSYNHNIRKESSDEVKYVSIISKKLGWRHKILKWNSPSKKNILEEARTARYLAISEFCKKENIEVLLLGHHQDDLIETFFMRVLKNATTLYPPPLKEDHIAVLFSLYGSIDADETVI